MGHSDESLREEVRKEFQLDRMILFSDAVFAIVITLMAIEIRLPESTDSILHLKETIWHLFPVVLSYVASFAFIGITWYRHLRMFGVLKDYDSGLVIRNLVLLFMVSLFPFGASVLTHARGSGFGLALYGGIIFACLIAQYALQHYILIQRPKLCIRGDLTEQRYALQRRKVALVAAGVSVCLIAATQQFISDPILNSLTVFWIVLVPIALRRYAPAKAAEAKAISKW